MIYKDSYAHADEEGMPALRQEPCLNCGKLVNLHFGWSCVKIDTFYRKFFLIPSTQRFLTQGMVDSLFQLRLNLTILLNPVITSIVFILFSQLPPPAIANAAYSYQVDFVSTTE